MNEHLAPAKDQAEVRILIVDDEACMAKATSRLLRTMGFKVIAATAGREAVEMCRTNGDKIDVVLLDVILPEMSSAEVLQHIRSLQPEVKVILTSGYGRQEFMNGVADMNVDGFLSKPFGYFELESTIREALRPRNM